LASEREAAGCGKRRAATKNFTVNQGDRRTVALFERQAGGVAAVLG
jgi:hypothetical protein